MTTYIIVDDESLIRKGTIKKLESLKDEIMCVGEASNGREALALIAEKNPDFIITDMNMPSMDGTQFLPILTEQYPQKHLIVISGYKDFEYTKHAIKANAVDYILKPFSREDIVHSVKNILQKIEKDSSRESQLLSSETEKAAAKYNYDLEMLKNSILGYHTLEFEISSDNLKFINESHNFVLLTLHSSIELKNNALQTYLNENGFGDLALYLQHGSQSNLGFLILFLPQKSVLGTKELCSQVIKNIIASFSYENDAISFGVSATHCSLSELNSAYLETVHALNQMHMGEEAKVCFYTEEIPPPQKIIWGKKEELLFRIEAGMRNEMLVLLDELFQYFKDSKEHTLYDVKCYCISLSDELKLIMTQYVEQVNPNSMNASVQNILNSMFDLEELKTYYLQFFINLSVVLSENSVYATDDTIEKIKIYVQRNYKKNLTIEFVSSLFFLNRSYCSHMFKEKTGDTFVNYVNSVRLMHAKEMLRDSDKKMYQIAKSIGYDNVKYFFRIFKKMEGITPEQYRNNTISI